MFNADLIPRKQNQLEYILDNITQEELFNKYFHYYIDDNTILRQRTYKALHRSDKTGTCTFHYFRNKLRLCDWATGEFLDVFDLIGRTQNLNFVEVLNLIKKDFGLDYSANKERRTITPSSFIGLNNESNNIINTYAKIDVKVFDKWLPEHIKYWKEYNIPLSRLRKSIVKYNVYAVQFAWINGEMKYEHRANDICFCYADNENDRKLYFPLRKKGDLRNRFRTNNSKVEGLEQLKDSASDDLVVITSSRKDVIILDCFDIPAICPPSEIYLINEDIINDLLNKFVYVILNPDKDSTGLKMARKYKKEYNLKAIFVPYGKDISGMIKIKGYEYTVDYLNYLKSYLS